MGAWNMTVLAPGLMLVGMAAGILLLDLRRVYRQIVAWLSMTALTAAPLLMLIALSSKKTVAPEMLTGDGPAALWSLFFCGIGSIIVLTRLGQAVQDRHAPTDNADDALTLLQAAGALIVAQSTHLLPLTIGLVTLHLVSIAWADLRLAWSRLIASGAGLACLLLGLALLYGTAGSLSLPIIVQRFHAPDAAANPMVVLSIGLIAVGLVAPWIAALIHSPLSLPEAWPDAWMQVGAMLAVLIRLGPAWPEAWRGWMALGGAVLAEMSYLAALRQHARHPAQLALSDLTAAQVGMLLTLWGLAPANSPVLFYGLIAATLSLLCLWAARPLASERPAWWMRAAAIVGLLSLAGLPPLMGGMAVLGLWASAVAHVEMAAVLWLNQACAWLMTGQWLFHTFRPSHLSPDTPPLERSLIALSAAAALIIGGLAGESVWNWLARFI